MSQWCDKSKPTQVLINCLYLQPFLCFYPQQPCLSPNSRLLRAVVSLYLEVRFPEFPVIETTRVFHDINIPTGTVGSCRAALTSVSKWLPFSINIVEVKGIKYYSQFWWLESNKKKKHNHNSGDVGSTLALQHKGHGFRSWLGS